MYIYGLIHVRMAQKRLNTYHRAQLRACVCMCEIFGGDFRPYQQCIQELIFDVYIFSPVLADSGATV